MVDDIEEKSKIQMEKRSDDEYLEFRMYKSDITNETILEITDFCDDDEVDEVEGFMEYLWQS